MRSCNKPNTTDIIKNDERAGTFTIGSNSWICVTGADDAATSNPSSMKAYFLVVDDRWQGVCGSAKAEVRGWFTILERRAL
mmetsp:Transcript_22012/g.33152  ORF Transcript_22012/g.33152 Transcript_22012/m.33152 type:complete len:81 (+) Transcript_22012:460-702(+)